MEEASLTVLLGTAVSIGFVHTLIGVDHSLPFVVIGRARGWSLRRVLMLTTACGVGHVLSSVLLGFVGIGLGVALEKLEWIEGFRGGMAAWLLIGFGLAYAAYAGWKSLRSREHSHHHHHLDGTAHSHSHGHHTEHAHAHEVGVKSVTAWSLFVIFVFGPCEPLIPLLMAPAAEHNWMWVWLVTGVFAVTTIGTMLAVVAVGYLGLKLGNLRRFERFGGVFAGLAIACSGLAIQVLGI